MASLIQHNVDCLKFLGEAHADVNVWMDEYFRALGPLHRRMRHHQEGVEEANTRFGNRGALAAAIHILRDCRHIPQQKDYELGFVDAFGLKKQGSAAIYIPCAEENLEDLVEHC